MIQFNCNACGNPFSVPESMGGTRASCNQCGAILTIPSAGLTPLPAALTPLPAAPAKPLAPPTRIVEPLPADEGGIPRIVWVLLGAGVAIIFVAIALSIIVTSVISAFKNDPVADAASPSPSAAESSPTSNASSYTVPSRETEATTPQRETQPQTQPSYQLQPSRTTSHNDRPPNVDSSPPSNSSNQNVEPRPAWKPDASVEEPPPRAKPAFTPAADSDDSPPASSWSGDTLRIPFVREEDVALGPIGCPIVVVANDVWHLGRKEVVQELEGDYETRSLKALSANGQWFAAALKSANQKDTAVKVWNVVTGQVACEIPGDPERFVDLITFTANKYLLLGGRLHKDIRVFDAETGKQLSAVELPDRVDANKVVFTDDGQYFTSVANSRLQVMKTKTRRVAAVMQSPAAVFAPGETPNEIQRKIATEGIVRDLQVIRFSPDSEEIAGVSRGDAPRLLVWSNRGKLMLDKTIPAASHKFFFDPGLEWFPDRSAWIVSGHIYDRESERVVMIVHGRFGHDLQIRAIDRDHLLANFPHSNNVLEMVRIPWDRINASLQILADGGPALVTPNEPVGIDIELAGLRGDQGQTAGEITAALEKRLQEFGFRVGQGAATFFKLRFSERAGDSMPIYERQTPFDFRGRDTGRTVREAEGSLVIELIAKEEVLWRDSIEASSSRSFREEINDATVRKSMIENVTRRIDDLRFPYFVPESKEHVALPIVIQ